MSLNFRLTANVSSSTIVIVLLFSVSHARKKLFCKPGYFISNGRCKQCPPNTFQSKPNTLSCIPCPRNENSAKRSRQCYCVTGTGRNASGICEPCKLGEIYFLKKNVSISKPREGFCHRCKPGEAVYEETRCTKCPPGFTASMEPGGLVCTACAFGTFKSGFGPAPCRKCPAGSGSLLAASTCTKCPPGKALISSGTCGMCPPGTAYKPSFFACSSCPVGTFQTKSTIRQDCLSCPPDSFSPDHVGPCIKCPEGQVILANKCSTCLPSSSSYRSECMGCYGPEGQVLFADRCGKCSPGTRYLGSECKECYANWYSSTVNAPVCKKCPDDSFSLRRVTKRIKCPDRHFLESDEKCKPCPPGYTVKKNSYGSRCART